MKIKKLTHDCYWKVHQLFDTGYPNLAFVYGIIERRLPGEIWVDNKDAPEVCLIICNGNTPYSFISGKLDYSVFTEFFSVLQAKEIIKLVCEPHSHDNRIDFGKYGFKPIPRLQYRYKSIMLEPIKIYEINSSFVLQQITNKEILNKCIWKSAVENIYGDANNYFENGLGFVLRDTANEQVASEAHGVIGGNLIEIGAITHENYRNRSLATMVCNQLIHSAIKKGWNPIWTCDESNTASNKVVQHQGMNDVKSYTFYTLKRNNM